MLTLATEAAKRAGDELMKRFGRASLAIEEKGPADFVTDADRAAEEAIRELLAGEVPGHGLLFEEAGATAGESDFEWVVDALDGTTNFIHRYPFFAVSLALREKGETRLAVVYDPVRGELFSAEQGEATRLNGVEVRVSGEADPARALVATGFPFRCRQHLDAYLQLFRRLFEETGGMRRDGAAALDLAYVAAGRYEAFWELGLAPWDVAGGALLVSCAGGQVTDFAGGDGHVEGGDVVASNGRLHAQLMAPVLEVFAAGRPSREPA